MKVRVCLDMEGFSRKPSKTETIKVNKRIAKQSVNIDMQELAEKVGNKGHTFCQAVFTDNKRKKVNFKEMQLLGLDFDSGICYREIKAKAEKYYLPIAFVYNTFSSTESNPKFRVVFVNDVVITDSYVADIIINMLHQIFDESDRACKDVSRMFFGGKGLLDEVKEETINIVKLKESFQRVLFERGGSNYARSVHRFAEKYNISCINNVIGIECVPESVEGGSDKSEEFSVSDQYIYTSDVVFPSDLPVYVIHKTYQGNVRRTEKRNMIIRIEKKEIADKCQLYRDFKELTHISHSSRFLLLTNMIHIEGGTRSFLSIIDKKHYDNEEWRFNAKYFKDANYHPEGCEGNCPYAAECCHKVNMVLTVKSQNRIVKKEDGMNYLSIEEVYEFIYDSMENAMNENHKGIYLIPAQTAIGKTEAYCSLISAYEHKRFIVAVPTNQLKREVEERLKSKGVRDILVTPSLDEMELPGELNGTVKRLYQQGLGRKVAEVLRRFVKENKNSVNPGIIGAVESCKKYLYVEKELSEKRVIVTTHARLVTFTEDIIAHHQVIIDEDILSTFFKNIKEVSITAIQKALGIKSIPASLERRLRQIQNADNGRYEQLNGSIDYGYIPEEELTKENICEDINDISFASTFQKDGEYVHYFYPQMMQSGKYIVLSATIDESLYKRYFWGWYIKSYQYYRAEYKGKLVQMTAYSMSRTCIRNYKEKLMEFVKQYDCGYDIITFQCFEGEFHSCGLHFGNTEGVDRLKGKNILIIGTPHQNEFVYKLIGCHLEMEVNEDVLSERRIDYGGYEFVLMTYGGKRLQDLQIYFIKKELEQSIGRARLLRENCKVVVLSNFPCEQAELNQENYLE